MKPLLFIAILLSSCGYFERHEEKDASDPTAVEELERRFATKAQEYDALKDKASGWPSADDCDGTLWAGLACAAGVPGVAIELAELAPGVIGRAPGRDCHAEGRSASTTSNDMASGYMWCLWRTRRLDLAQRFADACQARPVALEDVPACVIGEPYPEMAPRVLFRPNGVGLLGRIVYELSGGADDRPWRHAPSVYFGRDGEADFEKHLAALGIALNGEVDEGLALDIDGHMLTRLQELVAAHPTDWTFQAALAVYTGDYAAAIALLSDDATPCPSYARGAELNCTVSWLFAARLVLNRHPAGGE